jgi:hypothetical protein
VLVQGASANDVVEMVAFDVFSVNDSVSAKDGGSFAGNVAMAGTLGVTGDTTVGGTLQVGVDGTTAGVIRFMDSGSVTEEATISSDANGGLIFGGNSGPGELIFKTNSGTEHMRINSTGAVTMPLQPAFLAQPASQQANIGEGSEIDIAFGTERFDQNGDFASSVFTAPVTGKYFLSYSLWISNIDSVPSYFETYLTTSNRQYLHTFDPRGLAQDAGSRTINNALVADMDAGDTAKIQILIQSSGTVQSDVENYSFFSGYLVA